MNVQSIKNRLKNVARENSRLYQEVLTTYALERTLFRIGVSKYKENFTLKGGEFSYTLFTIRNIRVQQRISIFVPTELVVRKNRFFPFLPIFLKSNMTMASRLMNQLFELRKLQNETSTKA